MPRLYVLFMALCCSVMSVAPTWAQAKGATEAEPAPKSYVMSYFLVGAGIALGLVAVCRPSKRNEKLTSIE